MRRAACSCSTTSFAALGEELKRDGRNQAARRDLVLLRFTRARLAWQHSRSTPDAKALRDALAAMPAAAALAGDFYLSRWRADAAWWVGESSGSADEKLARAQEAEALMRATPDQPENASRRWMLAQGARAAGRRPRAAGRHRPGAHAGPPGAGAVAARGTGAVPQGSRAHAGAGPRSEVRDGRRLARYRCASPSSMKSTMRRLLLLASLTLAAAAAQADSFVSSAAGAGSASIGSVSDSFKASSGSSSHGGDRRAEGRYRVTDVAQS